MSNNNTPRLRFPGFTGDWEEKKLGELTEFKRGTTITAKETVAGNVPVIAGGKTPSYYHNVANRDGQTIAVSGSGAYAGFVSFWEIPVFLSDSFSVETYSELDRKYTYYYMKFRQHSLFQMQKGAGVPHVHGSDVGELEIPLPLSLSEQQKIASCLSEMDNLIAAQGQKVEALKEKKKGLMQQLFPQNGETTPRLRFPGFEEEWEYVNGDKLFSSISNKNHNSDLPILALTQNQGPVPRDMINYKVIVSDKSVASYKVVEADDFIISLRSFQGGIEYSRYTGLCSPAYIVLRKKSSELCSDFYRIYFKSYNYIQELNKNLEGIRDGKMISYKQFSEILLPKPKPTEQQKIASFLSEFDNLISSESNKLENLKNYKKGLMQQLFPQPVK